MNIFKKKNNKSSQTILFLDKKNLYEAHNPIATLVRMGSGVTPSMLSKLELTQPGVGRMGGNWQQIMEDGNIRHVAISNGRKSDYTESDYDSVYELQYGNY